MVAFTRQQWTNHYPGRGVDQYREKPHNKMWFHCFIVLWSAVMPQGLNCACLGSEERVSYVYFKRIHKFQWIILVWFYSLFQFYNFLKKGGGPRLDILINLRNPLEEKNMAVSRICTHHRSYLSQLCGQQRGGVYRFSQRDSGGICRSHQPSSKPSPGKRKKKEKVLWRCSVFLSEPHPLVCGLKSILLI